MRTYESKYTRDIAAIELKKREAKANRTGTGRGSGTDVTVIRWYRTIVLSLPMNAVFSIVTVIYMHQHHELI
jgi:hypothetical protein